MPNRRRQTPRAIPRKLHGPARLAPEDRILNAAERVILAQGFGGATLENIAREAGYSKGGLMHHFSSKQEVFDSLLSRLERRVAARRERLLAPRPRSDGKVNPPLSPAKANIIAFLQTMRDDPAGMTIVMSLLGEGGVKNRVSGERSRLFTDMAGGSARPVRVAEAMLLAEGLWLDHSLPRSAFKGEVTAEVIRDLMVLLDSLDKEPAAPNA